MKLTDALLHAWRDTLRRARNASAIFNADGKVLRTFGEIEECACEFEDDFEVFPPGRVIAIQIGNHEDWPPLLIACLRRQLVVLPLEESISAQQRDAALRLCNATAVVSAVPSGPAPKISRLRTADITATWDRTPSLLKLTSGTTDAPRAIRFGSQQLLADCNQICDTMGISDADLNFGVIPISHSYGFSNLLTPLIVRGVPLVVSQDRTPRAVLADIAKTDATVFPGMPLFYQAFCEMKNIPPLPKLRVCISAGAPLPIATAKKFRDKFALPIHSFYGASECGGICYDREAKNEIEGFVGSPMKDVDLEMIEPGAETSQVRVRSAAGGNGYFPDVDEEKLGNGVFVPDDLL